MSVFKKFWQKRREISLSSAKKIVFTLAVSLLTGIGMTVLTMFIRKHSISSAIAVIALRPVMMLYTALFIFMIASALSFLTKSVFVGNLIPGVLALTLAMINYFKLLITSIPLQYADFSLFFQLRDIARLNAASISFSRHDIAAVLILVFWLAALFLVSRPLRLKWKPQLIGAGVSAAAFALVFVVFANALVYKPIGIEVERRLPITAVENSLGLPLSLWRSTISSSERITVKNYSEETMRGILAQIEDYAGDIPATGKKPNIIFILSESFFDVTRLENVTFEKDPLANFRALCAESVSGRFYASTIGYGTSNIEISVMTGINAELMNNDENPCKWDGFMFEYLPSIPRLLSENGYYTASLHTFNDSIYVRKNYFYNLGFQETYFSEDFAAIDPEAAAAPNYWDYMNTKLSGNAYSDDYLADLIIKLYEQKSGASPVFLYGLTMENHTPYTETRNGEGFDFTTDMPISDAARKTLGNIAQGTHNSAEALNKLVDYFSKVDEPTLIVFFGDHRPGGGLTDNTTVYSQLGLVSSESVDWTLEQNGEFYSTSYLIWANDDSLLPDERGSKKDLSNNFLGVPVLEASGIEMPLYWRFLKSVGEDNTFFSWKYYISADGSLLEPPDLNSGDTATTKLRLLSSIFNDTFYGKRYITDELWSPVAVNR